MSKLSKAQERILRQVADGKVRLVYVGDNEHSLRVWDAVDKDGRKANRQYDALIQWGLVTCPNIVHPDSTRHVFLTSGGEQTITELGPAGEHIYTDHAHGRTWMLRKEDAGTSRLRFVLYRDGEVYDRYAQAYSAWTVFRSFCPYREDKEASLSR